VRKPFGTYGIRSHVSGEIEKNTEEWIGSKSQKERLDRSRSASLKIHKGGQS